MENVADTSGTFAGLKICAGSSGMNLFNVKRDGWGTAPGQDLQGAEASVAYC